MRVMKSKTLFESFQENLREIDNNTKHLKESSVIWSSDLQDDYADWSDEDFINHYKEDTGEEPEDIEQAKDYFLNDTGELLWDVKLEDLQSYVPAIQSQTTDNVIIMSGTVGVWTGNHTGGKIIELNDAKDLLIGDDIDVVRLLDEDGNLVWEGSHHDGTHYMGLYGLPKDEESRIKLVQELGLVDWYKDSYDYDNPDEDALDDALNDLTSASRLNDVVNSEDFETFAKLCPPIKVNTLKESALNEDDLEPEYSGRKSFYGKAHVDNENGAKVLTSYQTKIMSIKDGKVTMLCKPEHLTQTTLRHIREFLQQNGLEPMSKQELIKLINEKELNESSYVDLEDKEIITDIIDNFKKITGKEVKDVFNYDKNNENGGFFKQDVVDKTGNKVIEYLNKKGLDRSRIDDLLYKLDDELSSLWNDYIPNELNEQDTTVRVITSQQEDRNYSITDITELVKVADGDVRTPIDISGLLVEVDRKLTESYGADWGRINFQSTRTSKDSSTALFELYTGNKVYLMNMILEDNGTVLKVNNTNGKNIFKRKSNDVVRIAESYIEQFIPNNKVPDVIKHINQDLQDAYNFLLGQIEISKEVPKNNKEAFDTYLQSQIYAFVAEVSDEIKANEPTGEDKLELPSFDKMVEDIFGKQWVKEVKEPETKEVEGTETLKESNKTEKEYRIIDTKTNKVLKTFKADEEEKGYNEMRKMGEELKKNGKDDNLIYKEFTVKLKESESSEGPIEAIGYEVRYLQQVGPGVYQSVDAGTYENSEQAEDRAAELRAQGFDASVETLWNREEDPDYDKYADETNWSAEEEADAIERMEYRYGKKLDESDNSVFTSFRSNGRDEGLIGRLWVNINGKPETFDIFKDNGEYKLVYGTIIPDYIEEFVNNYGGYDKLLKDAIKYVNENSLNEADDVELKSDDNKEQKNGIRTGNAKFARFPKSIESLDDKAYEFTNGTSSYLVCSSFNLGKDEFDEIQNNLDKPNKYCEEFKPLDVENYDCNVVELTCPDYNYSILMDPCGSNFPKWVAKVGE